jgi:histidinol-phosphatase (PHP family)
MVTSPPVSVHGGHSGQFCSHARDTLEEIINAYIENGFPWVGITEHIPPPSDRFAYPEELDAGLDAAAQYERFAAYIRTCRDLQDRCRDQIRIHVGIETETYSGSREWIRRLVATFSPDYIVGSAHHVDDMPFDTNPDAYARAAEQFGGRDALYMRYFDQQYTMIRELKPRVVGHLDIIRIFDPDYHARLVKPKIWERIQRNLELIASLGLILDFNLRPLSKGMPEPYLAPPILTAAISLGINIVPGDDSHGVSDIATHIHSGIAILRSAGSTLVWKEPCP